MVKKRTFWSDSARRIVECGREGERGESRGRRRRANSMRSRFTKYGNLRVESVETIQRQSEELVAVSDSCREWWGRVRVLKRITGHIDVW
jgi:hypothetical protein